LFILLGATYSGLAVKTIDTTRLLRTEFGLKLRETYGNSQNKVIQPGRPTRTWQEERKRRTNLKLMIEEHEDLSIPPLGTTRYPPGQHGFQAVVQMETAVFCNIHEPSDP
jgi:hypothetical protein